MASKHDPAPPVENFHFWTGRHCQQCGLKIYGEEVAAQTIREHCGCQPMPIPTPPAPRPQAEGVVTCPFCGEMPDPVAGCCNQNSPAHPAGSKAEEPKCDCGRLLTVCAGCAVEDYQAQHPDCPQCCGPARPQEATPATDRVLKWLRSWRPVGGRGITDWVWPETQPLADDLEKEIRGLLERLTPAPPQERAPALEWEGPDEEGDYIVSVKDVQGWHKTALVAHGATRTLALHRLGEVLLLAGEDECPDCQAKLKGEAHDVTSLQAQLDAAVQERDEAKAGWLACEKAAEHESIRQVTLRQADDEEFQRVSADLQQLQEGILATGFDAKAASPIQHFAPCGFWNDKPCSCPVKKLAALLPRPPKEEQS